MKHIMRDGSEVKDGRLARVEEFDERSRKYAIPYRESTRTTKWWQCSKHLDQGHEGSCVGHGVTHSLIAAPVERKKFAHSDAVTLYFEAQHLDKWPGGEYSGAPLPHYSGTSVLAGCKAAKKEGYIESYRWGFGIADLISGIINNGPAVLGLPWYDGMSTPADNHYIHPGTKKRGGHCILCKGVVIDDDYDTGFFILHNSWGENWGNHGDCFISIPDMSYLLQNGGEAAWLTQRKPSFWQRFLYIFA